MTGIFEFDPNGVHLNDIGKMELAKAIAEEIKRINRRQNVQQPEDKVVKVEEGVAQIQLRERSSEIVSSEEINSSPDTGRHV